MVGTRRTRIVPGGNENENQRMQDENKNQPILEEQEESEGEQEPDIEGQVMEAVREVVPAIQPTSFSGKEEEDVKSFIKSYKRIARANKWTDNTKLIQLPCYLKGAAINWYETVEDQLTTFDAVMSELESVFTNTTQDAQKHFKLSTRYQGPSENLWEYFHEMLKLCHDVNPNMDEEEKIRFVLKGLNPKILGKVNLMRNDSVEELRSNLRKVEATAFLLGQTMPTASNQGQQDMQELRNQIARLEMSIKGRNQTNFYNTHKPKFENVKTEPGRTADGRVICFKCNKPGHFARNCFSRQPPKN